MSHVKVQVLNPSQEILYPVKSYALADKKLLLSTVRHFQKYPQPLK